MKQKLYNILLETFKKSSPSFTGLGLLICDNVDNIPTYPLYNTQPNIVGNSISEQLLELSSLENTHHDGFHILSSNFQITHIAQYFYPQPVEGMCLDSEKNYGARYFVAQAGSIISPVLYTAVVGNNYGIRIFQNGKEILGGEID